MQSSAFVRPRASAAALTCATSNIEMLHSWRWVQHVYKAVLPQPVQATAHQVVHDIILRRNVAEHLADEPFLVLGRDLFVACNAAADCFAGCCAVPSHRAADALVP